MKCQLPVETKGHAHDDRVVAVAKMLHRHMCGSHDGRKDIAAERWDKVGVGHQHRDCISVENIIWFAKEAGHPLHFDGGRDAS
jgi:hypothetical protein